jgi:hypothetical protein
MGLFSNKLASLGSGVKETLANAKTKASEIVDKIEVPTAVSALGDKAASKASDLLDAGKYKAAQISTTVSESFSEFDYDSLKRRDTYVEAFSKYKELGAEKVSAYYRSTFEVDKTTSEVIDSIRCRLPSRPKDIDDIFEQCRREAFQRAISAFCLAPIMAGLDNTLEARYSNLSVNYRAFSDVENGGVNVRDAKAYADMKDQVRDAKDSWTLLENGYNSAELFDPRNQGELSILPHSSGGNSVGQFDIEHVVSSKTIYNDLLLRIATDDDGIVDAINYKENLIFASRPLNQSKGSDDLKEYLEQNGVRDKLDPNLIHIEVKGKDIVVNEAEALEKYEKAQERVREMRFAAAKEIGLTVASAGARMAAQQVVGLIVMETIDIFVDEIKDIVKNGKFFDENGLLANIQARQQIISDKLKDRFEQRQIWARAKDAGIEGGIAGALSAIPQILISLIVKMPAFVLSMIRECTLSVVRSVRVLLSDEESKFDSIKVVMLGTASAVLGVYVADVISKAIRPVPMLNLFNSQVTTVLSGVVVTAVPLGAIYLFDQNRAKFAFAVLGSKTI